MHARSLYFLFHLRGISNIKIRYSDFWVMLVNFLGIIIALIFINQGQLWWISSVWFYLHFLLSFYDDVFRAAHIGFMSFHKKFIWNISFKMVAGWRFYYNFSIRVHLSWRRFLSVLAVPLTSEFNLIWIFSYS